MTSSCYFPFPATINYHPTPITSRLSSSYYHAINLHRPFLYKRKSWSGLCRGTTPQPEPPSKNNDSPPPCTGLTTSITRFRDTLQIFFAVLFWMSLFFWSSAWDGGNSKGKRDKGSRFRK